MRTRARPRAQSLAELPLHFFSGKVVVLKTSLRQRRPTAFATGAVWGTLEHPLYFGAPQAPRFGKFGALWGTGRSLWGDFGTLWGDFGATLGDFWSFWGDFGVTLEPLEAYEGDLVPPW